MIVAVVVVVVLIALALAIALADRIFASLAERKATEFVSEPFGRSTTVRVHGTPFLTQALRGRYGDIEVVVGGLVVGEMAGATLEAHLHDVALPLRELLDRRADKVLCRRVDGRIVLPYGEVARASRIPGLTLTYEGGRLVASAAVPVPGIGQLARLSGEAVLRVVAGNVVWLRIRRVAVAGISLPSLLLDQLLPSLSVPIALPELPYGLHVDDLEPAAAGLVVTCSADDVLFTAGQPGTRGER